MVLMITGNTSNPRVTMPDGRPCGLLVQRKGLFDSGLGRPVFWMSFTCDEAGKAAGMLSGFQPSPLDLSRSGLFPGIPAKRLASEKAHEPAVLPAGVPLRFIYAYRKDDPEWPASAEAAREAMRFFNMANLELFPIDLDLSNFEEVRMLFRKGVLALPHLHILYDDGDGSRMDVLSLDGPFDLERLMPELYKRFCRPGRIKCRTGHRQRPS